LGNDCKNQPWYSLLAEVHNDRRELAAARLRIVELERLAAETAEPRSQPRGQVVAGFQERLSEAMRRAMQGYDNGYRDRWIRESVLPSLAAKALAVIDVNALTELRRCLERLQLQRSVVKDHPEILRILELLDELATKRS
jgi:phenylalanine-4-hydroxylase